MKRPNRLNPLTPGDRCRVLAETFAQFAHAEETIEWLVASGYLPKSTNIEALASEYAFCFRDGYIKDAAIAARILKKEKKS